MHLHLPRLPAPLVMLSLVYATAIAVALANPGLPTVGALVVLAGLTARLVARHRRSAARAAVVLAPEAAPAPAAAA
ncbi:hypothetical protein [Blastococcus litoris]|uniref:hypothetical protein n=1 Tax=Blastococcus litoris TaxID=2171622 RepID=UPI001F13012C|nr:hypothetical protein [Blastococcus litoris]